MTPNAGTDTTSDIARMEATLNRMLRELAGRRGQQGSRLADLPTDQGWNWLDGDGGVAGLEVTEHALPDGVDFFTFQTLVGELH